MDTLDAQNIAIAELHSLLEELRMENNLTEM